MKLAYWSNVGAGLRKISLNIPGVSADSGLTETCGLSTGPRRLKLNPINPSPRRVKTDPIPLIR